jgi:hypothetical protein
LFHVSFPVSVIYVSARTEEAQVKEDVSAEEAKVTRKKSMLSLLLMISCASAPFPRVGSLILFDCGEANGAQVFPSHSDGIVSGMRVVRARRVRDLGELS